ncbi:hypothetical protein FO519_010318 [Halicephalobus sp. NKZ332]|nr:hypothetical protein FO519_010318 [Halicephalobus sp. NKZ332]
MTFCESSLFPNGNYTALVIGNSHAECGSGAVHMNPLFKKVITMSAHGVRVPAHSDSDVHAVLANRAIMEVVKKFQPDIIFYIHRHEGEVVSEIKNPITEDHGFKVLNKLFRELSEYTQEAFCGDNYCNPVDEDTGLPFIRDSHHAAILLQRKFRPILDNLAKKALKIPNTDTCNSG